MKKVYILASLLAAASCGPSAHAQYLGATSPQTVVNTFPNPNTPILNAVTVATVSSNVSNIGNTVHYVVYNVTGGTNTIVRIRLEGSFDGTNFNPISDTATNGLSGGLIAYLYVPFVRVNLLQFSGGGSLTANYTGTSTTSQNNYGVFGQNLWDFQLVTASISATVNQTLFANPPRGRTGGTVYFAYTNSSCTTSTLTIQTSSAPTGFSVPGYSTTGVLTPAIPLSATAVTTFDLRDSAAPQLTFSYQPVGCGGGATFTLFVVYNQPLYGLMMQGPMISGSDNRSNPVKIGCAFNTAPATVTNGQVVDTQCDAQGRLIATQQSGTPWVVAGGLTNNNAAPSNNNLGVLPNIAQAANPTLTEGFQNLGSLDLFGRMRSFNPDLVPAAGTITAVCASINSCGANSTVQVATSGYSGGGFVVTINSGSGTFNFDRSVDGGSTWKNDFAACWTATGGKSSITASDTCTVPVPGMTSHIRVRSSVCTGCNVTVAPRLTQASGAPIIFGSSGEAAFLNSSATISNGANTYGSAYIISNTTVTDGNGSTASAIVNSVSPVAMGGFRFNQTSWDRERGTTPSATVGITCSACTSTQTGADQVNYNGHGAVCTYDVTTVTGAGTFHLDIQGKDEVSGKYYVILTGANVSTTVTTVETVLPGITVAANVTASATLPRIWRPQLVYVSGTNQTATVGCSSIL